MGMPPRPRPRGRPRDLGARAAMVRAAAALLAEGGLANVTMERIAATAGVGKPTVYRNWPNAEAVAMEAFLITAERPRAAGKASASGVADLRAQLRAIAAAFAGSTGRDVRAMVAAAQGEGALAKAFRDHFVAEARKAGRAMLDRAAKAGELRPGLDPEVALDLLYGPLYYRLLLGHAPPDAAFVDALVDHALAGLAPG